MPETRGEKLFFGVVMSITMAVGMEIYNVAISMGYALQPGGLSGMTSAVFPAALAEAAYMWIFVFIFSNLWGNRLGHALAGKIIRPGQDNPFFITLMVSGCTVLVMCPTMSMAAALLFSVIPGRAPATGAVRRLGRNGAEKTSRWRAVESLRRRPCHPPAVPQYLPPCPAGLNKITAKTGIAPDAAMPVFAMSV